MEEFLNSVLIAAGKLVEEINASTDALVSENKAMKRSSDPSIRAKGQRGLANSTLGQTTAKNELKTAHASHARVVTKYRKQAEEGLHAFAALLLSEIATNSVERFHAKNAGAKPSTETPVPQEAVLLWQLLADRNVKKDMLDKQTVHELDLIAELFKGKVADYRHSAQDCIHMKLFRAGIVSVPVDGLTDDEAAALQTMSTEHAAEEIVALHALNKVAGVALQITPALALGLLNGAADGLDGLRKTATNASARQREKSIDMIRQALDLPPDYRAQAEAVYMSILYPDRDAMSRSALKLREDLEELCGELHGLEDEAVEPPAALAVSRAETDAAAIVRNADLDGGMITVEQPDGEIMDDSFTNSLSGHGGRLSGGNRSVTSARSSTRTFWADDEVSAAVEVMASPSTAIMDRDAFNRMLRSKQ